MHPYVHAFTHMPVCAPLFLFSAELYCSGHITALHITPLSPCNILLMRAACACAVEMTCAGVQCIQVKHEMTSREEVRNQHVHLINSSVALSPLV